MICDSVLGIFGEAGRVEGVGFQYRPRNPLHRIIRHCDKLAGAVGVDEGDDESGVN